MATKRKSKISETDSKKNQLNVDSSEGLKPAVGKGKDKAKAK